MCDHAAMAQIARNVRVDRAGLELFVAPRHHGVLVTTRSDGRPQVSLVTMGLHAGKVMISSYPSRAKVVNATRDPEVSVLVMSDDFGGEWVQVDGTAEVSTMPDRAAEDGLVDYFRCISGEHSDWEEYRAAMRRQGKSLIRVTIERWGPISRGGFPPGLAAD